MGNTTRSNKDDGVALAKEADALRLAKLLKKLDTLKGQIQSVKTAPIYSKGDAAEGALDDAADLLTDLVFITHQYAGRAEQLERRLERFEEKDDVIEDRLEIYWQRLNHFAHNNGVLFDRCNEIVTHHNAEKMDKLNELISNGGIYAKE